MKTLKLQGKMLLSILSTLLLVLALIVGYVSHRAGQVVLQDAQRIAEAETRAQALVIENRVESMQVGARALAGALGGMDRTAPGARESALGILREAVLATPNALSAWVVFEPDAFDGRDGVYAGKEGYGPKGRFMATLLRQGNEVRPSHDITEEMLASEAGGGFYREPLRTGEETVVEPYRYSYTGNPANEKTITTLSFPVRIGGKVVGVAGMDIDLASIQETVAKTRVLETGTLTLFSNTGIFLGSPNPDLVGKTLTEMGKGKIKDLDTILAIIREGRGFQTIDYSLALKQDTLKIHVPLTLGESRTPWSLSVVVPMGTILADSRALTRNILLASLAGLVFMTGVVVVLVRRLVRPIRETGLLLERFGSLDFTFDPSRAWLLDYRDEIGDMTRAMGKMQEALTRMIRTMEGESDRFTASAESLAALSQQSVASMEEVKASVDQVVSLSEANSAALQETNAGIEEVSSGSSAAADAAAEGAEASGRTARLSEEAVAQVDGVVTEMNRAGEQARVTAERMRQMADSVGSISGFVATIRGIADQTNLLALNAAIEAARAGEAGRGFAVVAEEVRKLAEESGHAAQEVETLIGSLKADAQGSLEATETTGKVLGGTIERAHRAQEGLREALAQIARVNDAMQHIAATSEEQAAAAQEMASGIDQVTKGTVRTVETLSSIQHSTDETSRASEQVAQESQKLSVGAQKLKEELARFRVDGTDTGEALRALKG